MERSSYIEDDGDRCEHLRWKGMYIDAVWDPVTQHGNDSAFWCHKTQICLGPDDKLVDEYECNPFRKCYREL